MDLWEKLVSYSPKHLIVTLIFFSTYIRADLTKSCADSKNQTCYCSGFVAGCTYIFARGKCCRLPLDVYLLISPQVNVVNVRENLPEGDFSIMTEMLKKFLNFMNLTVSGEMSFDNGLASHIT